MDEETDVDEGNFDDVDVGNDDDDFVEDIVTDEKVVFDEEIVVEAALDEEDNFVAEDELTDEDVVFTPLRLPHVVPKSPVFLKLSVKLPTETSNLVF